MGDTASCYDNAAMESVNGIIKTEALYCRLGKTKVKERRVHRDEILRDVISFISYLQRGQAKGKA